MPVTLSAIEARVRGLSRFGLDAGPATVESQEIEDEGWAHAWKIHFRPFAVGRLWITPTWDHTAPPNGSVVRCALSGTVTAAASCLDHQHQFLER